MQSFVRWAGSKRLLVDHLSRQCRDVISGRYIEPFVGSACLFFAMEPQEAILSDLNQELIQMYREVRRDPELVLQCFRRLPRGERGYYKVRKIAASELTPAEQAARFLYLNRYCFNGLFRTNMQGRFNVPYGPPKKPLVRFEDRVRACAELLAAAELLAGDFESVLQEVRENDFVYLDPPYAVSDSRIFAEYLPGSFSSRDLKRLRRCLEEVDAKGAIFLLSYADSPEAAFLYEGWHQTQISSRRNIAGFAGARRNATEILVSNREIRL